MYIGGTTMRTHKVESVKHVILPCILRPGHNRFNSAQIWRNFRRNP
uniref:Uncharacterized protein n=1 Tax=Setaria italica TaxID=4555 RepID=K3XUL8_SETIT